MTFKTIRKTLKKVKDQQEKNGFLIINHMLLLDSHLITTKEASLQWQMKKLMGCRVKLLKF